MNPSDPNHAEKIRDKFGQGSVLEPERDSKLGENRGDETKLLTKNGALKRSHLQAQEEDTHILRRAKAMLA